MANEGCLIEFQNCEYIVCKDYRDMVVVSSLDLKKRFILFHSVLLPCTGRYFSRYVELGRGELIFNGIHFPIRGYDAPSYNVKTLKSNLNGTLITFSILASTKELVQVQVVSNS